MIFIHAGEVIATAVSGRVAKGAFTKLIHKIITGLSLVYMGGDTYL